MAIGALIAQSSSDRQRALRRSPHPHTGGGRAVRTARLDRGGPSGTVVGELDRDVWRQPGDRRARCRRTDRLRTSRRRISRARTVTGGDGVTFAAVGGVAAQVTESAGTAKGIAAVVIGLCYMLRAVGDAGEHERAVVDVADWLDAADQALC